MKRDPATGRPTIDMPGSEKNIDSNWFRSTEAMVAATLETPLGPLLVAATDTGVCSSRFAAAELSLDGEPSQIPSGNRTRLSGTYTGFRHATSTPWSHQSSRGSPAPREAAIAHLGLLERRLTAYFDGRIAAFEVILDISPSIDVSLPVDLSPWSPSAFQLAVWNAVARIPPGSTLTYGELARKLGRPRAARAVARALASNPLQLIIPCHRVVPATGGIGGYAGGVSVKRALLLHESRLVEPPK